MVIIYLNLIGDGKVNNEQHNKYKYELSLSESMVRLMDFM